VELTFGWNVKIQESVHTNSICQLLVMVSAICLLGFTGCNSIDAGAGKGSRNAYIGKTDPQPIEDVVAANRDWYQLRD
jgi:hypothetical protein